MNICIVPYPLGILLWQKDNEDRYILLLITAQSFRCLIIISRFDFLFFSVKLKDMIKKVLFLTILLVIVYSNITDFNHLIISDLFKIDRFITHREEPEECITFAGQLQSGTGINDSTRSDKDIYLPDENNEPKTYSDSVQINSLPHFENSPDISRSDSSDILIIQDSLKVQLDQNTQFENKELSKSDSIIFPRQVNNAFKLGEMLTFKIRYGIIRAGTATMSVKAERELNNRSVYYILTTAKSAAGFNWIYKVEDMVVSYLDKEGLFSWKFEKRLREGKYKADLFVDYDPFQALANVTFIRYHEDMKIKKKENYQVKTTPFILDILASFYYVRTQELQVGKSIFLTNHDKKKVNNLEVKVYKKEIIEVNAGKFNCFVVEPLLFGEGIFKQKGRLKVWLTDDQYKIPVQMKSAVLVGNITTELEKIEGISDPIPSKK
jgi:hypothetical protein